MKNHRTDEERAEALRRGQDEARREWDEAVEASHRVGERIGLPLICPERACGRARRCVGRSRSWPPCWLHYREEARYLVRTMLEVRAHIEATGERPNPAGPGPERARTALEGLFGPDLSRLRRPKGAPAATHGWEHDPEAFDRYIMAGDWREPFRAPDRAGDGR